MLETFCIFCQTPHCHSTLQGKDNFKSGDMLCTVFDNSIANCVAMMCHELKMFVL